MSQNQLPAALAQRLHQIFENANTNYVVICNQRDRSILLRLSAADFFASVGEQRLRESDQRGSHPLPSQSIVDAFVVAASAAASPFDGDIPVDEEWAVCKFETQKWEVLAYRALSTSSFGSDSSISDGGAMKSASEGSTIHQLRLLMIVFVAK